MPAAQERGEVITRQPLVSGLLPGQLTADTLFSEDDYRKTWPRERFRADLRKVMSDEERQWQPLTFLVTRHSALPPQAALKLILAPPAVSCVVPEMMTPAPIDDGAAALEGAPLPADGVRRL